MHDRQVHGVAASAHLRRGDGLAVHRIDADRVLHRLLLRLLERAVKLVRRADQERAGEGRGEAGEARVERLLLLVDAEVLRLRVIFRGVVLAEHHVMARRAGDAVARERAVIRQRRHRIVLVSCGHGIASTVVARERLAGAGLGLGVDRELALADDAVAAEAGVLDHRLVSRDGRCRSRSRAARRRSDRARQGPSASRARCHRARC